jgi:hypothetical protein
LLSTTTKNQTPRRAAEMATRASTEKKASKSGNPAVRASAKASSVSAFKKKKASQVLELPSGEYMECRRIELSSLIKRGEIPNSLVPIITDALGKGTDPDLSKIVGKDGMDLKLVEDLYSMVEFMTIEASINPKVHATPDDDDERDENLLYVDDLEDEDKMFIYQWATGGTDKLEQFRQELGSSMATLAEISGGED